MLEVVSCVYDILNIYIYIYIERERENFRALLPAIFYVYNIYIHIKHLSNNGKLLVWVRGLDSWDYLLMNGIVSCGYP